MDTGREKNTRERTTMEAGGGHRGHNAQVSRVGYRGECRRANNRERKANSENWSVGSSEELDRETEEEGMPAGVREWSNNTLMTSP